MSEEAYKNGWMRILWRVGVLHVGKHGIRHRATIDVADSGVSVKIGMALMMHKAAAVFMRWSMPPKMTLCAKRPRGWLVCVKIWYLKVGKKGPYHGVWRGRESGRTASLLKYQPYRHRRVLAWAIPARNETF